MFVFRIEKCVMVYFKPDTIASFLSKVRHCWKAIRLFFLFTTESTTQLYDATIWYKTDSNKLTYDQIFKAVAIGSETNYHTRNTTGQSKIEKAIRYKNGNNS